MNWVKIFFTGGLGLVFALAVMFLVEKYGGIASEVANSFLLSEEKGSWFLYVAIYGHWIVIGLVCFCVYSGRP